MSRLATSFVLGYHGCELEIARKVVTGKMPLIASDKPYDWLGPGIYFWESDPQRALEWARQRYDDSAKTAVIGAVIDLRNCLDLLARSDQDLMRRAHESLAAIYAKAGKPLPANENLRDGGDTERRLRKLDCAVIRHLHTLVEGDNAIPAFDTVRGMFTEGEEIYTGSGFYTQSHVQIAVREPARIKGVFLPPELGQVLD